MKYFSVLLFSFFIPLTLQEVFDNAEPNGDYEKYIILDPHETYLGGISGINEHGLDVFIDCQGSIIDLNDQLGVWTYAGESDRVSLKIQYCNIINGVWGLNIQGYSTAEISVPDPLTNFTVSRVVLLMIVNG